MGKQLPMTKDRCRGCYFDDYNHGLGGATECWHFKDAKVILRKRVHVDERPPWKAKPELLPHCYTQRRFVFVKSEVTR